MLLRRSVDVTRGNLEFIESVAHCHFLEETSHPDDTELSYYRTITYFFILIKKYRDHYGILHVYRNFIFTHFLYFLF